MLELLFGFLYFDRNINLWRINIIYFLTYIYIFNKKKQNKDEILLQIKENVSRISYLDVLLWKTLKARWVIWIIENQRIHT